MVMVRLARSLQIESSPRAPVRVNTSVRQESGKTAGDGYDAKDDDHVHHEESGDGDGDADDHHQEAGLEKEVVVEECASSAPGAAGPKFEVQRQGVGVPFTLCPKACRWRDPQTGEFVKNPSPSRLTVQEATVENVPKVAVEECESSGPGAAGPKAEVKRQGVGVPFTFCPKACRWRDPQTGKFVKNPSPSRLTVQEAAYAQSCRATRQEARSRKQP